MSLLFISCVPWLNFTGCTMPFPDSQASNPNIVWGKYRTEKYPAVEKGMIVEKERVTIPVVVFVNHALVDGRHIAAFFTSLEEQLSMMKFPDVM